MNEVRLRQSIHVGDARAFGKWKLIWLDANNSIQMGDIPEKTEKALIAAGLSFEG